MDHHKKIKDIFIQQDSLEKLLQRIAEEGTPAWLVGGLLRDLLLNRRALDLDLAFESDPTPLAQQWSRQFSGHWFWLDRDRKQSRVVLPDGFQVDFALLRAETIEKDLQLRDFTINAMAFRLDLGLEKGSIYDPCNGQGALKDKEIILASPHSFLDDPLRLLKAIRHAVTLNFHCSDNLRSLMRQQSQTLKSSAAERIQEELLKILQSDTPIHGLDLMYDTGLLNVILGDPITGFDWQKEKEKLARFFCVINKRFCDPCLIKLDLIQQADKALFLIAELFVRYGIADPVSIMGDGLRFSRRQMGIVQQLISHRKSPSDFVRQLKALTSARQQAVLNETLEPFSCHKMINWSVTDQTLTMAQVCTLGKSFEAFSINGRVPDLLSGDKVQKLLNISAGSAVGDWLGWIKTAEITEEIDTEENAEEWLKSQNSI